jgi:hypothetical protein
MVPYVIRKGWTHRHGTTFHYEGKDTPSWYHILLGREGHTVMVPQYKVRVAETRAPR